MFLVPPHQLNRMTQPAATIRETVEDELDVKMRAVLDEQGLTPDEKIKKYNALLQRYLTLMKQGQRDQRRVTLTLQREQPDEWHDETELSHQSARVSSKTLDDADHVIAEVLKSFPPRDHNNTEYILKKISESDKGWNAKGEFVYNGQVVKGSHMTDLLKYLSRPYKSSRTAPPTGWSKFLNTLADLNIPSSAVKNVQVRDQYSSLKMAMDHEQNVMFEKETPRPSHRKRKKKTILSPTWIGISP